MKKEKIINVSLERRGTAPNAKPIYTVASLYGAASIAIVAFSGTSAAQTVFVGSHIEQDAAERLAEMPNISLTVRV
jgi:hypothetical protein